MTADLRRDYNFVRLKLDFEIQRIVFRDFFPKRRAMI
jgi:hypothetical protein